MHPSTDATAGSPGPENLRLAALPVAVVAIGTDGRVDLANPAFEELLGRPVEAVARPWLAGLFVESQRGAVDEVVARVLGGTAWQGELELVGQDGGRHQVSLSFEPVPGPGSQGPVGAVVLVEDVRGSRGRARRLAERLTRLARVIAELLSAEDVETITEVFTVHMADAAGATVASMSLVAEPGRLRLVGIRGGREGVRDRWRTYAAEGTPVGECLTARRPVVLGGREEIRRRYPDLETAAEGDRSIVCLPLTVAERVLGAVSLSFPGSRTFAPAELEFFGVMTDACAQALDRVQALEDAADQAGKLAFLADASAELSSSLDYEATLTNVAHLAVPRYADWCSIALGVDGELETISVAHADPQKVALALDFQRRYPPDRDAPRGAYQVFRTGVAELTPEVTDEMLDLAVPDPEQRAVIDQLNLRSALAVPLKVNDRVLGVITWVAGAGGRRFGERDLAFGEDLARRAAVAIDNARLHTELREMALRLQRAVLPAALPDLPGWDLAAHYSPTGDLDAGGDFYDVIALPDGRLALFIGDVMGRGVHAAAAMAQMRSSVRALVAVDPEPSAVLDRLDKVFDAYDIDQVVTMLYGVADPVAGTLTLANAGHLPPLLLHGDGTAGQVGVPDDPLLGAGGVIRRHVTVPFEADDLLLAFTDGLVERRHEDIDVGQQRLTDAARGIGAGPLPIALKDLVKRVSDPDRDDDVAVLAVRRIGQVV